MKMYLKHGLGASMNIRFLPMGLSVALLATTAVHTEAPLNKKTLFDRVIGSVAQSGPINKLNSFIASHIELQGPPARPEFQKIGADAQTAVGIPTGRQVPIREFEDMADGAAIAEFEAIYLSTDHFNCTDEKKVSYGVKRSDIHHEAVHIKYNDNLGFTLISPKTGTLSALLLTTMLKPQGKFKLLYPIPMIVGLFASKWLSTKYRDYCERRADIEGHYATQCSACVHEKAEDVREALEGMHEHLELLQNDNYMKEPIASGRVTQADRENAINVAQDFINSKKHYLSPDELDKIALDLKQQNKLCAFHRAQTANS